MKRAIAIALAVLLAGVAAIHFTVQSRWFQRRAQSEIRRLVYGALNMTVRWEHINVNPLALGVEVLGLEVFSGAPTDGTPFLKSPRVTARLSLFALFNRTVEIDPIRVESPVLAFGNDGDKWINFLDIDKIDALASGGGPSASAWTVVVRRVQLAGAKVDFFVSSADLRARLSDFSAEGRFDFLASQHAIPIRVSEGHGLYRMFGREFEIESVKADLAVEIIKGPWVDLVIDQALLKGAYPVAVLEARGRIVDVGRRHIFQMRGKGETELNFLNDVFFDAPRLTGTSSFDVGYSGDFTKFTVAGRVESDSLLAGTTLLTGISAEAKVTDSGLAVSHSTMKVFDGSLSVAGTLGFEGLDWTLRADFGNLSAAGLRALSPGDPQVEGLLTGRFEGAGELRGDMPMAASVQVRSPRFGVAWGRAPGAHIEIPDAALESVFQWDGRKVNVLSANLVSSREDVRLSGEFEPATGRLNTDVALESGDLSVLQALTGFPLAGWGVADGRWSGTLTAPEFDFNIDLREIRLPWFAAQSAAGRIEIDLNEVRLTDVMASTGNGVASLPAGRIWDLQGRPQVDMRVMAEGVPLAATLEPLLRGNVPIDGEFTGSFVLASPVSAPTGRADGFLLHARAWGESIDRVDGGVALDRGDLVFSGLKGIRGAATLLAAGKVAADGRIEIQIAGEGLELDRLDRLKGYGLAGTAAASMTVSVAPRGEPVIVAEASVNRLKWRDVVLGPATGGLHLELGRLQATVNAAKGHGRIDLQMAEGYPGEVTAQIAEIDVTPALPKGLLGESTLSLGGQAELHGRLADPASIRGDVRVDAFHLRHDRLDWRNSGQTRLSVKGGRLVFERALFEGDNTAFSLGGSAGFNGDLDLRVTGGADLQFFCIFIPQLKAAEGRLQVEGSVLGTLSHPDVQASVKIEGGRMQLRDVNVLFEDVNATGVFRDGQIVMDRVFARIGPGTLVGGGVMSMNGFVPEQVSLFATLSEAEARIPQWLLVRVNGRVDLAGPVDDVLIKGDLEIVRAIYDEKLDWEALVIKVKPRPGAASLAKRRGLHLDVGLHSAGSILIHNNLADAKLKGDLNLYGYPPDVGLSGNLQVVNGTLVFRENTFTITTGQINFLETGRFRPYVDLEAKTRVRETSTARYDDITLEASGPPENFQIDLKSSPPLSREDILSLLYIRRRTTDSSLGGGTATAEAVSLAFKLNSDLAGFQSEVQQYFGFEQLILEPAFTEVSRSGTMKLRATKVLRKNLSATLSTSLSSADLDFRLGYSITDNLLADVGWNSLREQQSTGGTANWGNFKVRPRLHFEFQ